MLFLAGVIYILISLVASSSSDWILPILAQHNSCKLFFEPGVSFEAGHQMLQPVV